MRKYTSYITTLVTLVAAWLKHQRDMRRTYNDGTDDFHPHCEMLHQVESTLIHYYDDFGLKVIRTLERAYPYR